MRTIRLACIALLLPIAAAAQTIYRCDVAGAVTYQQTACESGARVRELQAAPAPTFGQWTESAMAYGRQRELLRSIDRERAAEQAARDHARERELRAALAQQQREIAELERERNRLEIQRRHRELIDAINGAGYAPAYLPSRRMRYGYAGGLPALRGGSPSSRSVRRRVDSATP